jgi:hypothetical protein
MLYSASPCSPPKTHGDEEYLISVARQKSKEWPATSLDLLVVVLLGDCGGATSDDKAAKKKMAPRIEPLSRESGVAL